MRSNNAAIAVGVFVMVAFNEYNNYKNRKAFEASMRKHEREIEDLFNKFKSRIR